MAPTFPSSPLGVKVELNLNGTWTDISAYLYQRDNIVISNMGRIDETSTVQTGQLTLTLNNRDGRFTPKNTLGAYYPNITRNTPIRLSINSQSVNIATTPAMPASTVNVTNPLTQSVFVTITGGTISSVKVNGVQVGTGAGTYTVPAGQTISITYTVAPTWSWTTTAVYNNFRFFGEVSAWPPQWDTTGSDIYVSIVASGIWRRISRLNVNIGSSYTRYMKQLTGADVPASYWAMEDGSGSTVLVTTIGAGANATWTASPSLSSDGMSFGGSDALPTFNNSRINAFVTSGATVNANVIRFALSIPGVGDSTVGTGACQVAVIQINGTGIKRVDVDLSANKLTLNGYASAGGGSTIFSGTVGTKINGVPVLVSVELTPSGGNVAWAIRLIKPGAGAVLDQASGTFNTATLSTVSEISLNAQSKLANTTGGQLSVHYDVPTLTTAAAALGGHAGEFAAVRFQRICTEFNITSEIIGSGSAAMGPQVNDSLPNILQTIESTDGGLLYESITQLALGYRTLGSLQNQTAAVLLDHPSSDMVPPLTPTYDDQKAINQVTVTNYNAYTVLAQLVSGAMSISAPPNGIGLGYARQINVNANANSQANTIATQALFLGTVDDLRFPNVTIDLSRPQVASLFASVPGMRIGDYFQITNMPSYTGPATSKQIIYGYSETLNNFIWTIVFNTVPELAYETSFNPGSFTISQASTTGVAFGGNVGSSVSASQLSSSSAAPVTIQAQTIGGLNFFVSPTVPYDWTFAVSGTPTDTTYFIATADQTSLISVGDTFTHSSGLGGPFTVTGLSPPSGGNVNVYFDPPASSVMSSGTVFGGTNGSTWVNTSNGNQLNIWQAGAWSALSWNATSVIQASTITASLIAAGIIIAGIVNGTTIQGATIIDTGGGYFGYIGTPAANNMFFSSVATSGTDAQGNQYLAGVTFYGNPVAGTWIAANMNVASSAYGITYYSASSEAGPWTADSWLRRSGSTANQLELGPVIEFLGSSISTPATPATGAKFWCNALSANPYSPLVMKTDGVQYGLGEITYVLPSDQTISGVWAVAIQGGGVHLSQAVQSGIQYYFEALIQFQHGTTFTAGDTDAVGFTGPTVSQCNWFTHWSTSATPPASSTTGYVGMSTLTHRDLGAGGASFFSYFHAWGSFTPSANGTFAAAAGLGTGSHQFTVLTGTFLKVRTTS